jgi:hypothetical protein
VDRHLKEPLIKNPEDSAHEQYTMNKYLLEPLTQSPEESAHEQ